MIHYYKWDPCLKGEALLVQLSPDIDVSEGDSRKDSYHTYLPRGRETGITQRAGTPPPPDQLLILRDAIYSRCSN